MTSRDVIVTKQLLRHWVFCGPHLAIALKHSVEPLKPLYHLEIMEPMLFSHFFYVTTTSCFTSYYIRYQAADSCKRSFTCSYLQ